MTQKSHLVLNQQNGITVVSFAEATLLDAYHVNEISRELYALIEKEGHLQIVLDLSDIKMLSSQTLGVFLNMRHKLEQVKGRMVISGIDPRLYRVFKITNLQNIFDFFENKDDAVKSFA